MKLADDPDVGPFITKDQIVDDLINGGRLSDTDKSAFASEPKHALIKFHMSLGMWIRNTYRLWDPSYPYLEGNHPDDYSFEIIKALHQQLNQEVNNGSTPLARTRISDL